MRLVFKSSSSAQVYLIKGLLENSGIKCILKNEMLSSFTGYFPVSDSEIELWLANDLDLNKALEIINSGI
ncbi:MAG: DUF2007 domain-containing protein [Candidatus Omnitrophica bacterium]|nr:DUF2007 domain-containing protein [Candidatus Omnitrophota bacterium]